MGTFDWLFGKKKEPTAEREQRTSTEKPEPPCPSAHHEPGNLGTDFAQDHKKATEWFDTQGFPRLMRGDPKEANWFWDMSSLAFNRQLWKEAWAGFHYTYELFAKQRNVREIARCLWRLGVVYKRIGESRLSRTCLIESLSINRSLRDGKAVAVLSYELGEACLLCDDPAAAEQLLREAVDLLTTVDPKAREDARNLLEGIVAKGQTAAPSPSSLLQQARVYEKGNNLEKAADCYLRSAEAAVAQENHATAGDAGYFGHFVLLKLARKPDAARLLRISASANLKIGRKYEAGAGFARLGRVLVEMGDKAEGKKVFEECISVLKSAGASRDDIADVESRLRSL